MRILVTAGATREPLDEVRFLTNFSTGRTGAALTEAWADRGHQVTHLCGEGALAPRRCHQLVRYGSFADLDESLRALLGHETFDLVVHAAAVSDYAIAEIRSGDRTYRPPLEGKLDSKEDLVVTLRRNFKILERLKGYAQAPPCVVGFKLTSCEDPHARARAAHTLSQKPGVDAVVHNDLHEIAAGRPRYTLYRSGKALGSCTAIPELAEILERLVTGANA